MAEASKSDIVDILMKIHATTDAAVFVSDDGEEKNAVWLPKSQIEIEPHARGYVEVSMPEWLAMKKDLV